MKYPFKEPYLSTLIELSENPGLNSNSLSEHLNKPQSIVYRQLKILEKDKIIKDIKDKNGRKSIYEIDYKHLNYLLETQLFEHEIYLKLIINFIDKIKSNGKINNLIKD